MKQSLGLVAVLMLWIATGNVFGPAFAADSTGHASSADRCVEYFASAPHPSSDHESEAQEAFRYQCANQLHDCSKLWKQGEIASCESMLDEATGFGATGPGTGVPLNKKTRARLSSCRVQVMQWERNQCMELLKAVMMWGS